ncbi:MAG: T9SS type A sorting domain-containing protein, partial [Flavobacteriales bacterium]|nr:T9SS type A sorting domain-containing protein [Flavobacteriales bacterium]
GTASLRVTDVSGRIVARQDLIGTGITEVQLPELPNGLYALALESNRKVLNGTIIIQH